jgi:hypothetical protein
MPTFRSLATRTVVAVALSTIPGAVAVQRDLHIVNKVISPDGFTREYAAIYEQPLCYCCN